MRERILKAAILTVGLLAAAGLAALGLFSGVLDGFGCEGGVNSCTGGVNSCTGDVNSCTGSVSSCAGSVETAAEKLPLVPKKPVKGQLSVYFIDVGQGCAAALVSPSGRVMLIDSGESIYANRVEKFLKEIGVKRIDVMIGTHSHSDHIGAMPQLIRNFAVTGYVTTAENVESEHSLSVEAALEEKGVSSRAVRSGDIIEWDEACTVTALSPVLGCEYSKTDANDGCLMLRIQHGETALIIAADATAHAEQLSMFHNEKQLFEANLLLVAHHGSTTSSTLGFLETVGASTAVISVGAKNPYGHPDFDILNRLKGAGYDVLRTDELGSIAAFSNGETLEFAFQKPQK